MGWCNWLENLRGLWTFRELHLHGCGMKQAISRSGHNNARAVHLTSSETAHPSMLGFYLGFAGCCQHWTS